MAFNATAVFQVDNSTGSDSGAGGFDASLGGTDKSLDFTSATNLAAITCVIAGTLCTLSAYTVQANDVGNFINITGGSGLTQGVYEIKSVSTSANTWTLDRSAGTGTVSSGYFGGPFLSPGFAAGVVNASGNIIYVKSGTTYTLSTNTTNVSGGCLVLSPGVHLVGYATNRTPYNTDAAPTLKASSLSAATIVASSSGSAASLISNIKVDGASGLNVRGFGLIGDATAYNCTAIDCTNNAFYVPAGCTLYNCYASGCSFNAAINLTASSAVAMYCSAISNSGQTGINVGGGLAAFCVSASNSVGFVLPATANSTLIGCVAYDNSSYGFDCHSAYGYGLLIANSIAYGNTGIGFYSNGGAVRNGFFLSNCAYGGNGSGGSQNVDTAFASVGGVTLTSDPFIAGGTGNFALNGTGGGGNSCKAAGFPGALSGLTSTAYPDIGAVQGSDLGGGTNFFAIGFQCEVARSPNISVGY